MSSFAQEILEGLRRSPKRLSSKFFYDDVGSRLFQRIMALPSYYLTDCERDILSSRSPAIAARLPAVPHQVVELGPGDGSKTIHLLQALRAAGQLDQYVPIDISAGALRSLDANLQRQLPELAVNAIAADYNSGLDQLQLDRPWLVLFLGSSIGNFDRDAAEAFLRSIRQRLRPGDHLLLGADLKKDPRILQAAYDDPEGITRDFNRNLLRRLNRELGADFDLSAWQHHAWYNPLLGAMESTLLSTRPQTVTLAGEAFAFDAWEAIHTEYSFKYSRADLAQLAAATGFTAREDYLCQNQWFADALWEA